MLHKIITTVCILYAVGIGVWLVVYRFWGDAFWWSFLLNAFAVYLFLPAPLLLLIGLVARVRLTQGVMAAVCALGLGLHGGNFMPKLAASSINPNTNAATSALRTMTMNTLFTSRYADNVVAAIRQVNPDVVAFQELNWLIADGVARELSKDYPHQLLSPKGGPSGLGLISRYPLKPLNQRLNAEGYNGQPQLVELDWRGERVIVINVHTSASNLNDGRAALVASAAWRTPQILALAQFAQAQSAPLIVFGDLNISPFNSGYRELAAVLTDAWAAAGWGLGHTYPNLMRRSSRILGRRFAISLAWLVRIDYIWYSRHFVATASNVGPYDGQSDHRAVVADLQMKN
jgi:endonuclease/exonuclease/phosphatase (EEP) superfamily protein YafD